MSESETQGAVLLIVQDACNPYLADLHISCESKEEAVNLTHEINLAFPMCPHGRIVALEPVDTPESLRAKLEAIAQELRKREEALEEHKHRRIMGFISNVEEGNMVARLDGEEIDAFQLSSMSNEELGEVEFEHTPKGAAKINRALGWIAGNDSQPEPTEDEAE